MIYRDISHKIHAVTRKVGAEINPLEGRTWEGRKTSRGVCSRELNRSLRSMGLFSFRDVFFFGYGIIDMQLFIFTADFWSWHFNSWIKIILWWPCCSHIWHPWAEAVDKEFDQSFHNVQIMIFQVILRYIECLLFLDQMMLHIIILGVL